MNLPQSTPWFENNKCGPICCGVNSVPPEDEASVAEVASARDDVAATLDRATLAPILISFSHCVEGIFRSAVG